MKYFYYFCLIVFCLFNVLYCTGIDVNGYILYCPCMGRFGNQADHFLGALSFSKGLNRTLVLPPWVEYRTGYHKSIQIPFDTYFKVEELRKYHRVLTMEVFMEELAPTVWPHGKRIVLCYARRGDGNDCNAKEGNPFGPFWDTFGVDFDKSEFYEPLHYNVHGFQMIDKWCERFPSDKYPVLAFTGAPASFPVQESDRGLHQYLTWSDQVTEKAREFIRRVLPVGPFVGIHLRNGIDWVRACEHVKDSPLLFSAPQCLGYSGEHGTLTEEMCFPSKNVVLLQLNRVVKAIKARGVFVASDNNYMIQDINNHLKTLKVQAFKLEGGDPHVDLAILGLSNHFIGNCVSSFTAFAKRERDAAGLPSSFWAFPPTTKRRPPAPNRHDEF